MALDQLSLFADTGAPEWMAGLPARDRETLMTARDILRGLISDRDLIGSWGALQDYLTAHLSARRAEVLHVLYLDRKNRLIAAEDAGTGTVAHAPVYPREIARRALVLDASAVILAHNHPSGDGTPSQGDIDMSGQVKGALAALGITLHDSVVCAGADVVSLRAEGLL